MKVGGELPVAFDEVMADGTGRRRGVGTDFTLVVLCHIKPSNATLAAVVKRSKKKRKKIISL